MNYLIVSLALLILAKNFVAMMKPVRSVIVEDTGKASHHVEVIQTMNVRQTQGYQEMPDTYFDH